MASLTFGCGDATRHEATSSTSSPIQGGTSDTADTFAVAVIQRTAGGSGLALCSGSLLAPNLVATARHCVAAISSTVIDCTTSSFGAVVAAANLEVTTDATLTRNTKFHAVRQIAVPSAPGQASVCGNDIALLVLADNVSLPQYVTPTINPPMTDHSVYSATITAIGYGASTPTDMTGMTAGVRRIRQNIDVLCISGDASFPDCLQDPNAARAISSGEFEARDGTCEGDSGSGAFEQRSFGAGTWTSFGVLSRGGVDADGSACIGSIYTRFDAWGALLVATAQAAAQAGGYAAPSWATPDASAGLDGALASSEASAPTTPAPQVEAGVCITNGNGCSVGYCCSNNCVSRDQGVTFVCAGCDSENPCDVGLVCRDQVCVNAPLGGDDGGNATTATMAAPRGAVSTHAGCAVGVAALGGANPKVVSGPAPKLAWWWGFSGACLALRWHRQRRAPPRLKASRGS